MLSANPFCVAARLAAASAAARLGKPRAALVFSYQAQQLDGGHAETHYVAGQALVAADADQPALTAFVDSLNTSPRFVYAIADSVRKRHWQNRILARKIDDPRSLCWLAMNLPGADTDAKRSVAVRLNAMLNDSRSAGILPALRRAVPSEATGKMPVLHVTPAERLYLQGQIALWLKDQPDQAITYFQQSLAIQPLVWIRWHLAQAYRRAGRTQAAATELDAIHTLFPTFIPPDTVLWQDQ